MAFYQKFTLVLLGVIGLLMVGVLCLWAATFHLWGMQPETLARLGQTLNRVAISCLMLIAVLTVLCWKFGWKQGFLTGTVRSLDGLMLWVSIVTILIYFGTAFTNTRTELRIADRTPEARLKGEWNVVTASEFEAMALRNARRDLGLVLLCVELGVGFPFTSLYPVIARLKLRKQKPPFSYLE